MMDVIIDAIKNLDRRIDNIEKKVNDIKASQQKIRLAILDYDMYVKPIIRSHNEEDEAPF